MIGFLFSIIAGVLFFFIDTSAIIKTVAVIFGIFGGVLVITGIMTFLQWGQWFLSSADTGFYNIGFFTTVIAGVAIIILSIAYLITKPKRKKEVAY
ncbi:MAG: hypothetical protein ACFFDW_10960 [Candidatus Thorarchaeota archaeon]